MIPPTVQVRRYATMDQYYHDAQMLAQTGWTVQSTMQETRRAGATRCCLLGLFAIAFPPAPRLVVTYVYSGQSQQFQAGALPQIPQMPPQQAQPYGRPTLETAIVWLLFFWIMIPLKIWESSMSRSVRIISIAAFYLLLFILLSARHYSVAIR